MKNTGHCGKTPQQKVDEMIEWGNAPHSKPIAYKDRICGEDCDCKSGEDCYGEAALNLIKKLETQQPEPVNAPLINEGGETVEEAAEVCQTIYMQMVKKANPDLPHLEEIGIECTYNQGFNDAWYHRDTEVTILQTALAEKDKRIKELEEQVNESNPLVVEHGMLKIKCNQIEHQLKSAEDYINQLECGSRGLY